MSSPVDIRSAIKAKRGIKIDDETAEELSEVKRMLSKRLDQWEKAWREESQSQGHAEGRAEQLLELLEARFGALPEEVRAKVAAG